METLTADEVAHQIEMTVEEPKKCQTKACDETADFLVNSYHIPSGEFCHEFYYCEKHFYQDMFHFQIFSQPDSFLEVVCIHNFECEQVPRRL